MRKAVVGLVVLATLLRCGAEYIANGRYPYAKGRPPVPRAIAPPAVTAPDRVALVEETTILAQARPGPQASLDPCIFKNSPLAIAPLSSPPLVPSPESPAAAVPDEAATPQANIPVVVPEPPVPAVSKSDPLPLPPPPPPPVTPEPPAVLAPPPNEPPVSKRATPRAELLADEQERELERLRGVHGKKLLRSETQKAEEQRLHMARHIFLELAWEQATLQSEEELMKSIADLKGAILDRLRQREADQKQATADLVKVQGALAEIDKKYPGTTAAEEARRLLTRFAQPVELDRASGVVPSSLSLPAVPQPDWTLRNPPAESK